MTPSNNLTALCVCYIQRFEVQLYQYGLSIVSLRENIILNFENYMMGLNFLKIYSKFKELYIILFLFHF